MDILSNLNFVVSLPTIAIVAIIGFMIIKLVVKTVFKIAFLIILMILAAFFWQTARTYLQGKLQNTQTTTHLVAYRA
jgi:hypothetical protein